MAHSTTTQKFKEAVLGDKTEKKIGEFWFVREENMGNGISILNQELYDLRNKCKENKDWRPFTKKINTDRKVLKTWTPRRIREEDLPEWLR